MQHCINLHPLFRRAQASTTQWDRCEDVVLEADSGTKQPHPPPGRAAAGAQLEHPIRVMTHCFGSSPPPHTTESIKGRVAGPSGVTFLLGVRLLVSVCSFLLCLAWDRNSAHLLLTPPFSTHSLLAPPKIPPSRLTVAPHSLDRRLAAKVPRSKRRCTSCQGGIVQQSIPPKRTGGTVGQSCKVLRDR